MSDIPDIKYQVGDEAYGYAEMVNLESCCTAFSRTLEPHEIFRHIRHLVPNEKNASLIMEAIPFDHLRHLISKKLFGEICINGIKHPESQKVLRLGWLNQNADNHGGNVKGN